MRFTYYKIVLVTILYSSLIGCSSVIRFSLNGKSSEKIYNSTKDLHINPLHEKILNEVEKWIGTPYCFGGEDYNCVDCSGFVYNVFSSIGYSLPRTSFDQAKVGELIEPKDLNVGDLLFFGKKNQINHVAIYLGNGEIAHSTTSRGVVKEKIHKYIGKLITTRRILK